MTRRHAGVNDAQVNAGAIETQVVAHGRRFGPWVLAVASLLPAACASPAPSPVPASRVNEEFVVQGQAWRDAMPPAPASGVIRDDVSEQFKREWLASHGGHAAYRPARVVESPAATAEHTPVHERRTYASRGYGYDRRSDCDRGYGFALPLALSFGWYGSHGHHDHHGSYYGISTGFPLYW